MKKTLAILLLAVLFVGAELPAQDTTTPSLRTWKDSTGQFSIRATFVRFNGDLVVLQGIDKKEISLPLTKLSVTDQKYVTITNTIGIKLNLISAGTFIMGSPETEKDRDGDELQHEVTITKAFYMQTTEVTQGQWKAVMGTEPWKGREYVKEGASYPAIYISWNDAVEYCKKLSEKEGKTYRLPTEAEWEYACRAGTQTTWSFGNDETALSDYAWITKNASDIDEQYAHQVGLKKPNGFGLYDMHGNVWEWCHDYYEEDYYKQSPEQDPMGPANNRSGKQQTTLRGGAFYSSKWPRSANRGLSFRSRTSFGGGFRLVHGLD